MTEGAALHLESGSGGAGQKNAYGHDTANILQKSGLQQPTGSYRRQVQKTAKHPPQELTSYANRPMSRSNNNGINLIHQSSNPAASNSHREIKVTDSF